MILICDVCFIIITFIIRPIYIYIYIYCGVYSSVSGLTTKLRSQSICCCGCMDILQCETPIGETLIPFRYPTLTHSLP